MQGLLSEHDGFYKLIENIDCESNMESDSQGLDVEPRWTCREKISHIVESRGILFLVSVLLIVDCIVVSIYLLLEMEVMYIGKDYGFVYTLLHVISLFILSVFVIEILLRMVAMGRDFFESVFDISDTIVIFVSVVFDIAFAYYGSKGPLAGMQVVILFRFWRITRILNGIVSSVRGKAKRSIQVGRFASIIFYSELEDCRRLCDQQAEEISRLQAILVANNIRFSSVILDPPL